MMHYTYAHTKSDGTIFYIGKGQGRRAWDKKQRNQFWHNVVNKNGGFQAEVLAYWETHEEALSHEVLLISCFKDMGYTLANLSDGGEGCSGYKYTEEQRQNRSGSGNGMFGRERTEEELNSISEGTKHAMQRPEVVAKLKAANTKENNPNWGKVACNAKQVTIDGITFTSHTLATKYCGVSLTQFNRKLKRGDYNARLS